MTDLVLEPFAGPGGWSEGRRLAGHAGLAVGFDSDRDACRTAMAAGHQRVCVDVTTVPLEPFVGRTEGVIISPPCDAWSVAGAKAGYSSTSGRLIREPLRWCLTIRPVWAAWECTPLAPVRARFAADAEVLRRAGYHVWTGVLNAADYGVPSTRKRAVLIAHRDRPVGPPPPALGAPVSMSDTLGWDGAVLVSNYGHSGDARRRGRRPMHLPAFTMTGKCARNRWEWPDGTTRNLAISEAGQLQSFRPDYPWSGGRISQQQQIGDAMPPLFAAAVLRLLGLGEGRCAA